MIYYKANKQNEYKKNRKLIIFLKKAIFRLKFHKLYLNERMIDFNFQKRRNQDLEHMKYLLLSNVILERIK